MKLEIKENRLCCGLSIFKINDIINNIEDTVEIINITKPKYNFKADN